MPGPFAPNDSLVGPIVHAIAVLIKQQIPSITFVYEDLPDRAPGDNTVILPLMPSKIKEESNGKMRIALRFSMRHLFRRKSMGANVKTAYTYVLPWLQFLAAWPNQNLGGLARSVSATDLALTQQSESGQPMVALVVDFIVLTEFNIPLT